MTSGTSTRTLYRTVLVVLGATFFMTSCGSGNASTATTASPTPSITVRDAWARTSPSVAGAGAVYLTLVNAGDREDSLIGVVVDPTVAGAAQLHETVAVETGDAATPTTTSGMASPTTAGSGSMMTMRPVGRIVAPANGSVALKPGSYHIMLTDLVKPLALGSTVDVTLDFETSPDQVVTASIRDTAP